MEATDQTPTEQTPEEMMKSVKEFQAQQKYFECLELMEKIITQTHQKYGVKSTQYIASQEKMCEICNSISMLFLTKDKKQLAFEFLKRSETFSSTSPQLQIITFNNFSCYYKKVELYTQAIEYLQKAITLGNRHQIYRNLADSYLNLCSINSLQNKHKDALQNVLMAIYLLQNEMVNFLDSYEKNKENDEFESKKEIIYVLAVAHHNLGVELEYLKRYDEALAIYEKATKFAVKNLGKDHELVSQLTEICVTAKQQIENQKNKQVQKQSKPKQNAQFYMTQQNIKTMQKQYQQQGGNKMEKINKKQNKFNNTNTFKHPDKQQQGKQNENIAKEQSGEILEKEQILPQKVSKQQLQQSIEKEQIEPQQIEKKQTLQQIGKKQIQPQQQIGNQQKEPSQQKEPQQIEKEQKEPQQIEKEQNQQQQIDKEQSEQQVEEEAKKVIQNKQPEPTEAKIDNEQTGQVLEEGQKSNEVNQNEQEQEKVKKETNEKSS